MTEFPPAFPEEVAGHDVTDGDAEENGIYLLRVSHIHQFSTLRTVNVNLNFSVTFDLSDKSRELSFPSKNSADLRSRFFF